MRTPLVLSATLFVAGALASAAALAQQGSQDQVTRFTTADGTRVTLTSGQPPSRSYGPKPSFEQLDVNRDGVIDRSEAEAFIPLDNDFDNLAHHVRGITRRMYDRWDYR